MASSNPMASSQQAQMIALAAATQAAQDSGQSQQAMAPDGVDFAAAAAMLGPNPTNWNMNNMGWVPPPMMAAQQPLTGLQGGEQGGLAPGMNQWEALFQFLGPDGGM